MRRWFEQLPDGRYVGHGEMDSNGVDDHPVPFDVVVEIEGSNVRLDYSGCAAASRPGPINCPLPSTVSASRIAISMLAGGGEAPNEGHFRAIEVDHAARRRCSIRCTRRPASCTAGRATRRSRRSTARSRMRCPRPCPPAAAATSARSSGGASARGRASRGRTVRRIRSGQGAHAGGDGANSLMHVSEAATRITPIEVWEAKNPWIVERFELAPDSCGPGRQRGGLGLDIDFTMREDAFLTSTVERTKNAPWGLAGGGEARANSVSMELPDGTVSHFGKVDAAAGAAGCHRAPAHRRRRRLRRSGRAHRRLPCTPTCARATSASSTRAGTSRTRSRTALDRRAPDRRG